MLPDVLQGSRFTLRPFRLSDVAEFHSYISDPEMGRYLEGPKAHLSEDDVAEIIKRHMSVDKEVRQVWATAIDDAVVGAVTINFAKDHRVSEIGYSVRRTLWGKGIASEATELVVSAAFKAYPQLQRVQANIHPENAGSIKVAESAGMEIEGRLRSYAFVDGEPVDELIYAILREKWNAELT